MDYSGRMSLVNVAIPSPLPNAFTYEAPEDATLRPGMRVLVPFRRRPTIGVVLELPEHPPEELRGKKLQAILEVPDDHPLLSPALLNLVQWMARYYCAPIGEAVRAALPGRLLDPKAPRTVRPQTPPEMQGAAEAEGLLLTGAQQQALDALLSAARSGQPSVHLLHGITGSGKTEVYLRLLAALALEGRQGLLLVPEIGLTNQLTGRASARFGDRVAVYHSGMTDAQRHAQWERIRTGCVDAVIGTRSALFAPLPRLGAIVVDEEHDASFKQDEGVAYHGRDAAVMRAHLERAVAILGSATPSLESLAHARSGKYACHLLPGRTGGACLPDVQIVDLRRGATAKADAEALRSNGRKTPQGLTALSPELHAAIGQTLERGEQTLLYLGRRGFASAVHCEACGDAFRCPNCDIALVAHLTGRDADAGHLACHYCDYRIAMPRSCAACGSDALDLIGQGTQRLEAELHDFFPDARIARLDSDVVASPRERQRIFSDMRSGKIDILVGTQMVTKGHDFPGITLVGVILADMLLHLPDFRAAERTFQLLIQVAGRAGRGERPGRVIIQTHQPGHVSIASVLNHDGEAFAEHELAFRKMLSYPPFGRLVNVRLSANSAPVAEKAAAEAAAILRRLAADPAIRILGPAKAPLARIRGRHRWQLLIKAPSAGPLGELLSRARPALQAAMPRTVRLAVDVDPVNLL